MGEDILFFCILSTNHNVQHILDIQWKNMCQFPFFGGQTYRNILFPLCNLFSRTKSSFLIFVFFCWKSFNLFEKLFCDYDDDDFFFFLALCAQTSRTLIKTQCIQTFLLQRKHVLIIEPISSRLTILSMQSSLAAADICLNTLNVLVF